LDRRDTEILKGLAIIAIAFHNFFHVIGNVRENEFDFDPGRFPIFLHTVVHPSLTIQALFAFFGHFGVQIFIFLSAYGMAKSHWDDQASWPSFMWSRIKKFYPIFGTVVFLWAILAAFDQGPSWLLQDHGLQLLLMFAGVSNLVPGIGLPPIGPWWFIPFIMQFYAIWPLLRRLTKQFGWHGLLALSLVCLIITQIANPFLHPWSINLTETPLGRMRVFCFGIIAARYQIRLNVFIALLALGFVILGNAFLPFAPLASLSAAVLCIWAYTKVRSSIRNIRVLELVGKYSLAIFLLNGIVRTPFLEYAATPASQLGLSIASFLVTFGISYVLQSFFSFDTKVSKVSHQVPTAPSIHLADASQIGNSNPGL